LLRMNTTKAEHIEHLRNPVYEPPISTHRPKNYRSKNRTPQLLQLQIAPKPIIPALDPPTMLNNFLIMTDVFKVLSDHIHDILFPDPELILNSLADHINKSKPPKPLNEASSQSRDKIFEASIRTFLEELFLDSSRNKPPGEPERVKLISVTKTDTRFSFTVKVHQSQVPDCAHDILYLVHDAEWWKEVKEVFKKGGFGEQTPQRVENGYWLLTWGMGRLNVEEEAL
jgi:hypothetical protein